MNYKILIVDDEPANIRLLERLFRHDYQVFSAFSGKEALDILTRHEIALIITDQRMPEMTGVELLKRSAEMRPHTLRIILTGYTDVVTLVDAINSGVVYKYVTKPWDNTDLKQTVNRALEFYETNKNRHDLARQQERLSESAAKTEREFTRFIAEVQNSKDERAHGHARRTSMYATAVGYRLGLTGEDVEQLSLAAFLHNLGAGCASDILSEIDQPINEESRIAQFYNERSALMLAKAEHLSYLEPAIRHYRERFDGSGYPSGLAGEQIPLFARIVAVAAAYDEMTSSSIFRSALSHEEAVFRLQQNAETIFDPVIVGAFCGIEKLGKIRRIIESELSRMQLFADQLIEDASAPRLSEILRRIKTEPWLAMQVLREANALLPDQPTAQLLTAATRLGEEKMQLLLEKYGSSSYNGASKRWSEFAVRRAVTAQLLAAHTDLMNSDEAYTLGLLYDIGAALLTNLFPNEMEEMQQLEDEARFRREIEIFGIERAQVSQWILGKCGLREVFTSTISSDCRTMCLSAPTALLITAAHRLARAEDDYKVTVIDSFDTGVLAILRLSRGNLNRIYECAAAISSEIIEGGQEMYEYA